MNSDLFEYEQAILDVARSRQWAPTGDAANQAAWQALVEDYGKLLGQSRRLNRVGHTLERQRLLQLERKNAELMDLHRSYARFVPREILDLLLKQDITQITLGDHIEFEMAILFADIRNFTGLSETMSPEQTFSLLNAYLAAIAPIIKRHDGVIDKILGDGIMAYFPAADEEALLAALEIQQALRGFNRLVCRPQFGVSLELGIGLHLGPCILGTLGDTERMNTTVVSDAVNIASRIESLTKLYHCPILISQEIFQRSIFTDNIVFRFVDSVVLKGKNQTTSVYEPRLRDELDSAGIMFVDRFERAALAYHEGQAAQARGQFAALHDLFPDDVSCRIYLERCGAQPEPVTG
jgi:two-component system sensor histidine kinase ChiS